MKKILSLILCVMMIFTLAACGGEATETPETETATLKFGAGVFVDAPKASDATAEKVGEASVDVTVAAVTVDAEGKIVACRIDTMQNKAQYTTEGKAVIATEFKTKRELGKDYGMVAYGGAKLEWFEQADALEKVVAGKTLDQVKALMVEGYKPGDELVNAGCTVTVSSYIGAIEKAYNAAAESNVTANDTLKIGIATSQDAGDATADAAGKNNLDVDIFVAAVNAEGKVVANFIDVLQAKFSFDVAGKSTFDTSKALKTKKEQGKDYGMVAYGGAKLEWFEQAAAFETLCNGKSVEEIKALMVEGGKGTDEVINAGCTITVNGFIAAASKI